MRPARDRNQGFTVLELILAVTLGVVVLGGAYMVYEAGWSTVDRSERKADLQQNVRALLDMLVWQIRHAGFRQPAQNLNLSAWPDTIVIGGPNLLVIRGDVRATGNPALSDTLFALQPPGTGVCPSPPSAYPLPACPVTGINVYTVAGAPPANYTVVAFNAITALNFAYFDGADVPLLAVPLDGVGAGAFPDGMPAPNPLPGPTTCPGSGQLPISSCRNSVRRIQIVLTGEDRNVTAGPGIGSAVEQIAVTGEIRLRNTGD